MMKTLKYIVLLTVMLVNVTPYIKDGKVEWKANEAAAQNYVCESNWFQRLIGVYKCKKNGNEEDWFYGVNDSCKIANNQHICSNCHGLFAWTALEIPILCPDCQKEHPDIDPYLENGDNPDDGGSEPGSTTPPGGNTTPDNGTNITPSKETWMASLSQTEKGLLRSNPCEIALNPTSLITANETKDSSDCIFFVVESLTDKKAADEAALHPNGILDSFSANYGESKCDSIYNYLTRCGINITSRNGPKNEAELIETLKNCDKGVIILFDTGDTKIVNNKIIHISHIMIITGLAYEEGQYKAMVYDTRMTTGVNNDVITGKEIIADLNLSNSVTWVIE